MAANATARGAIHDRWNADAGLMGASLSLFNEEPVEGTPLSTCFYIEDFQEPAELISSSGKKRFPITWTFVGQIVGTASAEALAALVQAAFPTTTSPTALNVTGRTCVLLRETHYSSELDKTRSTDTRRVTRVELDYQADMLGA